MNHQTEKLLEATAKVRQLEKQLAEAKKEARELKQKPKMAKMNCLFSPTMPAKAKDISLQLDGFTESEVARCAMYLGLKEIENKLSDNKNQARGLMHISRLRYQLDSYTFK